MLTNKRILIKSGVTGGNIDSIFYEKVENTHLRINLIGKITGTGSLFIDTGEKVFMKRGARSVYHKIDSILKPYEIYKILQEQVNKKIKRTSKKGSIEE